MVLLFTTTACDKSANTTSQENDLQNSAELFELVINDFMITCSETCEDGAKCQVMGASDQNYVECTCEGCTMTITQLGAQGYLKGTNQQEIRDKIFSKNLFLGNLKSFVLKKHKTEEFYMTLIEYVEYGDEYYLIYDFETNEGVSESVMYAYVKNNSKNIKTDLTMEGFEIDCNGSCDDAGQTCRERYVFNPPSAECTCAGSCKMTVTPI